MVTLHRHPNSVLQDIKVNQVSNQLKIVLASRKNGVLQTKRCQQGMPHPQSKTVNLYTTKL